MKARYVPSERAYFSRASFVQESMWIVANIGGGQTVLPIQIEIRGVVDKTLLEKSLNAVVARQEVLRTTLVWRDDEVAQRIHDELMVEIETITAREQSGARRQETPIVF